MSIELEQPKNPEAPQQPETTPAKEARLEQFLRYLYDSVAGGRAITSFKNALARVNARFNARMWGETKNDRPKNELERQPSGTFGNNPDRPDHATNMPRREFLKAASALGIAALTELVLPNGLLNPKTVSAAELNKGTQPGGNNQETLTDPNEILRQLIESAKEYIATEVPMLTKYTEVLECQARPNNNIGIQIPADIGNPPSSDGQVTRNGFELGAYTYSPYLDPKQPEKGRVYKRILEDLQTIKNTFSLKRTKTTSN